MPKNIIRYDLLISCPGDVQSEIELIKESVEVNNKQWKQAKNKRKITLKAQGKYCVYFKFKSKGKTIIQKTKGFYIDSKVPTVKITSNFTIKATDKGSGIKYIKVNGVKVKNGYKLQPGSNDIIVLDKAGNKKRINVTF